ncbi:MAG: uroporphyrinogen-III synthase [Chloroflexi bacterium]|nr:MAG: uroporphyrinogen-III synthase [Chloroflexota bacterium]
MYERFAGKTVVLTREPADNAELASRIGDRAARIVELPCVRTEPLNDTSALAAELAALREDDWLVVTSRHGAEAVAPWGQPRAAVAAIGAATAERLRAYGVRVAFQPSASSGAALARELPRTSGVVLLARSDRALSDLPRVLRERGFTVREVVAYRTLAEARGDVVAARAVLASASSGNVASLSIASPRSTPQWPWVVYSQRQTSAMSARSGTRARNTRSAAGTGPSGSAAFSPRSSFSCGRPKSSRAPTPARAARSPISATRETGQRAWPGSDVIGDGASIRASTNTGRTNAEGVRRVSATSRRSAGVRRSR